MMKYIAKTQNGLTMRATEGWYGSAKEALSMTIEIVRFVSWFSPPAANASR